MKGYLRWTKVSESTGEYQYDLGIADFDTDKKSMRDTIVEVLLNDWDCFGGPCDCITVVEVADVEHNV